ncbi:hypothetical protein DAI22_07g067400 [Oryza sativa Japonica Group]|nr:hypothetical protein DAI22_07g067400 [Oryza sativa Japonica Group]
MGRPIGPSPSNVPQASRPNPNHPKPSNRTVSSLVKPNPSKAPATSEKRERERESVEASGRFSKMLSSLSAWLVNPRRNPLARLHMNAVASRLRKYGLRYDDLYDPYHDLDIKEALARLPREVVDARNQRLKRAMDLSMKHQYLPADAQAKQTPFRGYLSDMLALVKKESAEREALGALPLYQRTIP